MFTLALHVVAAAISSHQQPSLQPTAVSSAGGTSRSTTYTLSQTVGEPGAGAVQASQTYRLQGGFWAAVPMPDPCPADINDDGLLNGADFNAWLAAFNIGSLRADQNNDGMLNGADFNAWLANFSAGCP